MRDVMFLADTAANKFYFFNLMLLNAYILVKFAYECWCVYRTRPRWYSYFGDPYRNIEFVNLVFFMVTVLLRVLIRREFAPLLAKFGEAEEFVDTIHLRDLCLWCDRVNAINAILSVLKFFKYVRFSAQLTLPVDVLMLSMTRMAVLSVVIGILLVGCGAGNRPDRRTSELVSLARNEVFSARFWTGDHLYARSRGLADPSRRIRSNWTMLNVS